ncbi:MAG: hypothetical protein VR73_00240 [Gammaproteobacteria bacterium BRH_c0]|nr:MAG: hypothetical protein VR73_00240 [Gammaproteobacteria bacterium BRH_c0]
MHALQLTITFQLPGCASLKEKRARLRRLADHFGRDSNIAVTESDFHDQWQRGQWSFVIVGENQRIIEARSAAIETYCHQLDAYVTNSQRQLLC